MHIAVDIVCSLMLLFCGLGVYTLIFWLLINKEMTLGKALQLCTAALVLNKFLFTGIGYAAVSGKLKSDEFPLHKSISAFVLSEMFVITPWVVSGLYFGARVGLKIPLIFIIFLLLALVFLLYKRKKAQRFLQEAAAYVRETSVHLGCVLPLAVINILISITYYYFLFDAFRVSMSFAEVFKIVSVSFTVGYLSPLPSGLAFREGSMIFLLMQQGLAFNKALSIALTDRLAVTVFFIVIGFLCAAQIIIPALTKSKKG